MEITREERRLGVLLTVWAGLFLLGVVACAVILVRSSGSRSLGQQALLGVMAVLFFGLAVLATTSRRHVRRHHVRIDLIGLTTALAGLGLFFLGRLSGGIAPGGWLLYGAVGGLMISGSTVFAHRRAITARYGLRFLSPRQALTLRAIADVTIAGAQKEVLSADELSCIIDRYMTGFASPRRVGVKILWVALEYFPLLFLNVPLSWMGHQARAGFIRKRFFKSKGYLRDLIRGAKQLIYLVYYGDERTFSSVGFVPFEQRPRAAQLQPRPEPPLPRVVLPPKGSRELETDICIIGSGAAGAVLAYKLAVNTNQRVTVLERGGYHVPNRDFSNREPEMIARLYTDGGLQMTQDFDLAILQGSCVGGTTVVNNGICFRIPEDVLREWAALGCELDAERFQGSFEEVESRIGVRPLDRRKAGAGSLKFMEGCQNLNLEAKWFQTNFDECVGSGYCNLGCKYDRKLSVLLNYLPWATDAGAEIIAGCTAKKIESDRGRAFRVRCKRSDRSGFSIKARSVIVCCGTVASTALLMRSGIRKNVGTRVSFNVASPMHAEFDERLDSYDGVQMCCYVEGDGFLLETTFNPPAASALIMPGWFEEHFARMLRYPYLATAAPVVGTLPNGRIKINLVGLVDVPYVVAEEDFLKLKEGLKLLARIFLAAGAKRVLPATFEALEICTEADIARIDEKVQRPEDVGLTSAHPQGGNPMSDDRSIGAIDTNFKVYGYEHLYVCDASLFPTSVKINPQLTIMALADYAAGIIVRDVA